MVNLAVSTDFAEVAFSSAVHGGHLFTLLCGSHDGEPSRLHKRASKERPCIDSEVHNFAPHYTQIPF
jgi:hypothetical protein